MLLLEYFRKESVSSLQKMVVMAVLSGISNGIILALINAAAESVWNKNVKVVYLVLYSIILVLFIYSKKFAMSHATTVVEQVIRKVRVRIADKIRSADLAFIERLGHSKVFTTVTQDTNLISQTAVVMINAVSSAIMLTASLFYIAYLSLPAFLVTMAGIAVGVWIYALHRKELIENVHQSNLRETEFFGVLDHIFSGFKQIKINHKRSQGVFAHLSHISEETEKLKIKTGLIITTDYMFSQVFYYSLIAVIIFILPMIDPSQVLLVMKLTAAILFIMGPLDLVVGSTSLFTRATAAVENLQSLEADLDQSVKEVLFLPTVELPEPKPFGEVILDQVEFHYMGDEGEKLFSLGPVQLTIRQGELLYIVGGNGSGKSTLLKLLTGLYYPHGGSVTAGGQLVDRTSLQNYRELYSIVFTDFHLFDKLYGVQNADPARVQELLKLMELDRKTKYVDGRFTHVNLSTGQRKRLALIASILEDKQIYIFDECAADQDPHFKRFFYEELLKDLQRKGKTVIAVTHDDSYFGSADRVIKMEYGKIVEAERIV